MLKELETLNKAQREAAQTFDGPLLVLAGPGSGKTKTLVTRVANMVYSGVRGSSILVLTFTNKAAREMKERGNKMLEEINLEYTDPTFTTFHSWCFKFVKKYAEFANENLTDSCQVATDNKRDFILKTIVGSQKFKEKYEELIGKWDRIDPKKEKAYKAFTILQNKLCAYDSFDNAYASIKKIIKKYEKNGRRIPYFDEQDFASEDFFSESEELGTKDKKKYAALLFTEYKRYLRENNLIDFDDIINLSIKILKNHKDIREKVQSHYNYIMVDEFQDTNSSQMELLDLIVNENDNICVVGDDSQSIYGWRGAEIDYILGFSTQKKKTKTVNLNINYRSTKNIVRIVNNLLGSCEEKHEDKESLTAHRKEKGVDRCFELFSPEAEAAFIANEIKLLLKKGVPPSEIVVLYRTNNLAKSLEADFLKNKIPYQIQKGTSLFQRKTSLEFLSLIAFLINREDSISLSSYLVGEKAVSEAKMKQIISLSYNANKSCAETINALLLGEIENNILTKQNIIKLQKFFDNVKKYDALKKDENDNLSKIVNHLSTEFGLFQSYIHTVNTSKSEKRVNDAESSIKALETIKGMLIDHSSLEDFYENTVLASEDMDKNESDKVKLMTAHASKGLEFEHVFLMRFNNNTFPAYSATNSAKELEEERRLAFVALSRAKTALTVSYVKNTQENKTAYPSIFLREAGLNHNVKKIHIKRRAH